MFLGIGYSATAIFQTKWGLGLSARDFPLVNAVPFSRVQYAGGPLYTLAILGFKVSLLASYLRLAGFNRTYRYVLYTVMALVVANQLIYTFLLSLACRPIAKQWDPTIDGTCIDELASYFGLGGSSLGFDILIILLPFPILRRLQLDVKKKIALGCLFALGFFVSIIQIIRVRTIAKLVHYTDSEPIIIWSIVEINLGVFIACTPSFAPLLKQFGNKVTNGYQSNSQSKRQKATAGADYQPGTATNAKRLSKGNVFSTGKSVSANDLETAEDEVMLWSASRRAWPAEAYAWGGNAHPMTDIQAKSKMAGEDHDIDQYVSRHEGKAANLKENDARGREITVVREISVQTHDPEL
ncbi:hypothetical protein B0A55_11312 [Friedmanniomyces simplex]|uniref:Rhodopsin domain-containing protein n=1 Tax=Friedmanniomyces simplex TaxID=329884 RepID=A0A4U0WIB8_9PEZI|nr:hypothetical protein B0A55_11312 [Friedmanniomyces simplex]